MKGLKQIDELSNIHIYIYHILVNRIAEARE